MSDQPAEVSAPSPRRRWYQSIGPGLITACVVIGPGSILTSSTVGATHGFQIVWVLAVAVVFMMVYTMLGAKLGVVGLLRNGQSCRTAGRASSTSAERQTARHVCLKSCNC